MNQDSTSLDRLHDLVVPPAAPWWPPAPGWYWMLGLAGVALLLLALRGIIVWQRNRYRREALAEWRRERLRLNDPAQRAVALRGLSELWKRTALSAYPREMVAGLTGARWLAFLERTSGMPGFPRTSAGLLENAAYDSRTANSLDPAEVDAAAGLVRDWIRHHDRRASC